MVWDSYGLVPTARVVGLEAVLKEVGIDETLAEDTAGRAVLSRSALPDDDELAAGLFASPEFVNLLAGPFNSSETGAFASMAWCLRACTQVPWHMDG